MVRNTTGGSKTKSQARKSFISKDKNKDSFFSDRTPKNEFEQIATVSKLLGNGMCYVLLPSSTLPLICHIRGKFRGRSKKHNVVSIGSSVLIGLRDWEAPNFKNVDLLDILSNTIIDDNLHNDDILFSHSITDNNLTTLSDNTLTTLTDNNLTDFDFHDI